MVMDRLPKRAELVFQKARKTLYLRLTTVIRSLGTKFSSGDVGELYACANLQTIVNKPVMGHCSKHNHPFCCVVAEVHEVHWLYQLFIVGKSGNERSTRKLEAGIARLEWLRDNWNDLEVTGDLKHGYELVLKSDES